MTTTRFGPNHAEVQAFFDLLPSLTPRQRSISLQSWLDAPDTGYADRAAGWAGFLKGRTNAMVAAREAAPSVYRASDVAEALVVRDLIPVACFEIIVSGFRAIEVPFDNLVPISQQIRRPPGLDVDPVFSEGDHVELWDRPRTRGIVKSARWNPSEPSAAQPSGHWDYVIEFDPLTVDHDGEDLDIFQPASALRRVKMSANDR